MTNNRIPSHEEVAWLREEYPKGTRIQLHSMNDPYSPVESGTEGTVTKVDAMGTLRVNWDNGRSLGVIVGEDSFSVLSKPELEQEPNFGEMMGQS